MENTIMKKYMVELFIEFLPVCICTLLLDGPSESNSFTEDFNTKDTVSFASTHPDIWISICVQ